MTDIPNREPAPSQDTIDQTATKYEVSTESAPEEFLAAAKLYAREIVDTYGLSVTVSGLTWKVSTRAKRRAGAVKHQDGDPIEIILTWGHFESKGWTAMAATIRHELIHVHLLNESGDHTHGDTFQALAEFLQTPTHCARFSEPEWWVHCSECDARWARYRKSKLVKNPSHYACGECGGALIVTQNE